ncbi:MAG: sigma-70 family RNA polymerase sigma factor [Pseudomonadota bacterium]
MPTQHTDLCQDRAWLDAFRRGEAAALERVFRCYAPLVWALVRRGVAGPQGVAGVSDPGAQQDLVQDVFVQLLAPELRQRYDGLRPYAALVCGVTRNIMLDRARRQGRRLQHIHSGVDDAVLEQWQPSEPLPDELLADAEQRFLVREYVASLDQSEQQVVRLRFEQGLSQRDAAEAAGLGRQQVRSLEHKIRDGLRRFLDQREGR